MYMDLAIHLTWWSAPGLCIWKTHPSFISMLSPWISLALVIPFILLGWLLSWRIWVMKDRRSSVPVASRDIRKDNVLQIEISPGGLHYLKKGYFKWCCVTEQLLRGRSSYKIRLKDVMSASHQEDLSIEERLKSRTCSFVDSSILWCRIKFIGYYFIC